LYIPESSWNLQMHLSLVPVSSTAFNCSSPPCCANYADLNRVYHPPQPPTHELSRSSSSQQGVSRDNLYKSSLELILSLSVSGLTIHLGGFIKSGTGGFLIIMEILALVFFDSMAFSTSSSIRNSSVMVALVSYPHNLFGSG